MTETQIKQLEYAIKHDPFRYFVKRGFLHWKIVNADGELCSFYFTRSMADVQCALLNNAYSFGYTVGQQSILKIILEQ